MLIIAIGVFIGLVLFAAWGSEMAVLVRVATIPALGWLAKLAFACVLAGAAGTAAGLVVYGVHMIGAPPMPVLSSAPPGRVRARLLDGSYGTIPEDRVATALENGYSVESEEEYAARKKSDWESKQSESAMAPSAIFGVLAALVTFIRALGRSRTATQRKTNTELPTPVLTTGVAPNETRAVTSRACRACTLVNDVDAKFCKSCGARLAQPAT
ncbi:MAG TPA: zinc ribbon domain-containing protein [Polyangiaceae bacterium]|jgi:hypothetical protein|nr:zinc ribbon domain-containing protein [Polyangiaceae bacterium]